MVVVDLYTGSHPIKHEQFNLTQNPLDGKFYGYCPKKGNLVITKLGASKKDDYIDDVLVVYTTKKENSNDRKIIAFCPQARAYRKNQSGKEKERLITEGKKYADYSIESDSLVNLENNVPPFIIKSKDDDTPNRFRMQRFYGREKYPDLCEEIIAYIEGVLNNGDEISDYQKQV